MKLLIVSHVDHKLHNNAVYAYGPYVREMNLWIRHASEVRIAAPSALAAPDKIDLPFAERSKINFYAIAGFNFMSFGSRVKGVFAVAGALLKLLQGMFWAEHIHVRCPGNMGLLGLVAQILFPHKTKTVKYAGNWEDYPGEHRSYRIQKWIAKNTLLTHKTFVLIYGKWDNFTRNCVAFFTASYTRRELEIPVRRKSINDEIIHTLFVGTLDERKRPDLSIEVIRILSEQGIKNISLTILGEGPDRKLLEELIVRYQLEDRVFLKGNVPPGDTMNYYQASHVLIFLSRMEGWPKVVAESMFWGCVPVTTAISCVPWMLDKGQRGLLVPREANAAATALKTLIESPEHYTATQQRAVSWARSYTLDYFETEITRMMESK